MDDETTVAVPLPSQPVSTMSTGRLALVLILTIVACTVFATLGARLAAPHQAAGASQAQVTSLEHQVSADKAAIASLGDQLTKESGKVAGMNILLQGVLPVADYVGYSCPVLSNNNGATQVWVPCALKEPSGYGG